MCKFYHSLLILRKNFENSDRSMYAICVINFVHNLRCLLKNLRSQQKFYATAGCTGCDKYELCIYVSGPKETQEAVESGINGFISNGCSCRRLFCKVIGLYVHLTSSKTAFPPCTIHARFFTKEKVFSLGCFIIPFPLPVIIVYALKENGEVESVVNSCISRLRFCNVFFLHNFYLPRLPLLKGFR